MKNTFKLFGIIALAAVIGFTMAACDNGSTGGGDNPPGGDPNMATYTGAKDGTTYTLKITKAANTGTPSGGNPFVGIWNGTDVDGDALRLTFTETSWTWSYVAGGESATGTYTYSGATATLSYSGIPIAIGVISGGTLRVTGNEDDLFTPWTLTKGRSVSNIGFSRAITPAAKDAYELAAGAKKSTGEVQAINGNKITLKHNASGAAAFEATVSGTTLTDITGTIPFDDGSSAQGPGALTGGTGGGGGGSMTWTLVSNSPFDSDTEVVAIAYGNGKFVAVGGGTDHLYGTNSGAGKKMAYSSDGKTWTAVTDILRPKYTIAYGNGKFVAGGNGKMAYSTDGVNWTAVDYQVNGGISTAEISAITYGNNKFFAVGAIPDIMATSTDGVTWTAATDSPFSINTIAYGNGKIVAGGNSSFDGVKMAYSPDEGKTWTAVNVGNIFGGGGVNDIAFGNNKFVAVSMYAMAVSTDGMTWTKVNSSIFNNNQIRAVAYGNNKFVAAGNGNDVGYSPDGITWTRVNDILGSGAIIYAIAFGNGTFVAVGSSGKMAYSTGN